MLGFHVIENVLKLSERREELHEVTDSLRRIVGILLVVGHQPPKREQHDPLLGSSGQCTMGTWGWERALDYGGFRAMSETC